MDQHDPNVVARLVALNERTRKVWAHPHNEQHYVPASLQSFLVRNGENREITRRHDNSGDDAPFQETEPELKLYFNNPPKDISKGWMFGSDRSTCDVYCGERNEDIGYNISSQTFSMTFDKQGNVILKHLKNTNYTTVKYESQKAGHRQEFVWIMFPFVDNIIVTTANHLKFQVKVVKSAAQAGKYKELRRRFLEKIRHSMPSMPLPSFNAGATTVATGLVSTSKAQPFYYLCKDRILGYGNSGIVYVVIDASTGIEYAGKKLFGDASRNEVDALAKKNHINVLGDFTLSNDDGPLLVTEYFKEGNIARRWLTVGGPPWSIDQIFRILEQALQGLVRLHAGPNRVIHGNVKPENILVTGREPQPKIKLGDFGIEGIEEKVRAGTWLYAAPEILDGHACSSKGDIWSLGAVMTQLFLHGEIPKSTTLHMHGRKYCENLVITLNRHYEYHDNLDKHSWVPLLYKFVRDYMLQLDPKKRLSAQECLNHPAFQGLSSVQPVPNRALAGRRNDTNQHPGGMIYSSLPPDMEIVATAKSAAGYERGVKTAQISNGQSSKVSNSAKPLPSDHQHNRKADSTKHDQNRPTMPGASRVPVVPDGFNIQKPNWHMDGYEEPPRVGPSCIPFDHQQNWDADSFTPRLGQQPVAGPSRVPPNIPRTRTPDWYKHHYGGNPMVGANTTPSEHRQSSKPTFTTPRHEEQHVAGPSRTPRKNQDRKGNSSKPDDNGPRMPRPSLAPLHAHPNKVPGWYKDHYDSKPMAGPSGAPSPYAANTHWGKSSVPAHAVQGSSNGATSQAAAASPTPAAEELNVQFTPINRRATKYNAPAQITNIPPAANNVSAAARGSDDEAHDIPPNNFDLLKKHKDGCGTNVMFFLILRGDFPAEDMVLE